VIKRNLYLARRKNFKTSIKPLLVNETDLSPQLFKPEIQEALEAISSSVKVTSMVKGGLSF